MDLSKIPSALITEEGGIKEEIVSILLIKVTTGKMAFHKISLPGAAEDEICK